MNEFYNHLTLNIIDLNEFNLTPQFRLHYLDKRFLVLVYRFRLLNDSVL